MNATAAYNERILAWVLVDECDRNAIAVRSLAAASALVDAQFEAALQSADECCDAVIGASVGNLGDVAALALLGMEKAAILSTLDRVDSDLVDEIEQILSKIAAFSLRSRTAKCLVNGESPPKSAVKRAYRVHTDVPAVSKVFQ